MSLVEVIADYQTGIYEVTRAASGDYVDGHYVQAGPDVVILVPGSLQPVSGRELSVVPEGISASDTWVMYTQVALVAVALDSGETSKRPDTIRFLGEDWRVFKIEGPYNILSDGHYRAYITRIGVP